MTTVTENRPRLCNDDAGHDDRWCSTCEAMWDGVYMALDWVENHYGHGRTLEDGFVPSVKAATKAEHADS